MTNVRTWTISLVAFIALAAAALIASGAVSSAQELPTETPVASADVETEDRATEDAYDVTEEAGDVAESDEGDAEGDADASEESDDDGDGRDCPEKNGAEDDSSTETTT